MKFYRQDIARRYRVDVRTVDRWKAAKLLPTPKRTPGGLPFWTDKQLATVERCPLNGLRRVKPQSARRTAWLNKKLRQAAETVSGNFTFPMQLTLPVKI